MTLNGSLVELDISRNRKIKEKETKTDFIRDGAGTPEYPKCGKPAKLPFGET